MELDGASTSVKLMDVQTFDKDIKLQSARVTKQDQSPFLVKLYAWDVMHLEFLEENPLTCLFYIK